MKRTLPFILALLFAVGVYAVELHAQATAQPQTNMYLESLSYSSTGVTYSNLTSVPPQTNGTLVYCSDCQQTTTCASGGSGAMAKMVAGTWKCVDVGVMGATSTPFAVNGSPVPGTAAAGLILGIGAGGTPIWTASPSGGASTPFAVNGSAIVGSASPQSYLVIGAGGTPTWAPTPAGFTVNGSAVPATAAAGSILNAGPGGTPAWLASASPFAVNGSPVAGTAAVGFALQVGAGGSPAWAATSTPGPSRFMTFQFGNITAVPTASIIQDEHFVSIGGTATHLTVTTTGFTCSGNPTINIQDCGTNVNSCSGPTTIGSTTIATASAVDVNLSSSAITANHYIALQWTAGTCTVLSGQAELTY